MYSLWLDVHFVGEPIHGTACPRGRRPERAVPLQVLLGRPDAGGGVRAARGAAAAHVPARKYTSHKVYELLIVFVDVILNKSSICCSEKSKERNDIQSLSNI